MKRICEGDSAILGLAAVTGLLWTAAASAADGDKPPLSERPMWHVGLDNDILTGSDDAFSAGFSIQRHSPHLDTWEETRGGKTGKEFALWVGKHIPGLGDDGEGGRIVRRASGVGILMQTPADIENPDPQPFDVPGAGTVVLASAWSAYDNRRLAAVQLMVGNMGPHSGAEQIQKFVHEDLGLSDSSPAGWDNQLGTELLGNLNYVLRYKPAAAAEERYQPGRFAGDLSLGGQVGLGNYFRFAEVQAEIRWGWGMPMGFTHIPDPIGRGIMLDPAYVPPGEEPGLDRTRFYFSVVPRFSYFEETITLEGGETENGGFHPGVDYEEAVFQTLFGFHIARKAFALHLTFYYFPDKVFKTPTVSSPDWANISFEWRF